MALLKQHYSVAASFIFLAMLFNKYNHRISSESKTFEELTVSQQLVVTVSL